MSHPRIYATRAVEPTDVDRVWVTSRHLLSVQHLVELYSGEVGLLVICALQVRLTVEDRDRVAVELLGALASASDAQGAELAVLGERPDQVEHDPLL